MILLPLKGHNPIIKWQNSNKRWCAKRDSNPLGHVTYHAAYCVTLCLVAGCRLLLSQLTITDVIISQVVSQNQSTPKVSFVNSSKTSCFPAWIDHASFCPKSFYSITYDVSQIFDFILVDWRCVYIFKTLCRNSVKTFYVIHN